jgi:hypothetical protein
MTTIKRVHKKWTEEDDDFMRKNYGKMQTDEIKKALGRSLNSLYQRARQLELDAQHFSIVQLKKQPEQEEQEQQELFGEKETTIEDDLTAYIEKLKKQREDKCNEIQSIEVLIEKINDAIQHLQKVKNIV